MELIRCLFLALLSCLVFSTVPAISTAHDQLDQLVVDTDGHPVISGLPYYIRAARAIKDPNLGWISIIDSSDLMNVLFQPSYGPPVIFFPEDGSRRILLNENLFIMFDAPSPASTLWKVDRSLLVTTGGVKPSPTERSRSRFRIVRESVIPEANAYQFVFCPDPETLHMLCMTIGSVTEDNISLLGESTPMPFTFIKVPPPEDNKGSRFKHV